MIQFDVKQERREHAFLARSENVSNASTPALLEENSSDFPIENHVSVLLFEDLHDGSFSKNQC